MLEAKWITRVEDGVIKKDMKAIGPNQVINLSMYPTISFLKGGINF